MRVKSILIHVLKNCLTLLHPFMPFLTESVWQIIKEKVASSIPCTETVMESTWPEKLCGIVDKYALKNAEIKYELVRAGRNLRAKY